MSDEIEDLKQVTRKTAAMLFGEPSEGAGGGAYSLLREFDKDLAKHISMFYTGRLYAREVVSQKQRELCAVAALTSLHMPEELRAHVGAAMRVGATREEVAEVIMQMVTYAGMPKMLESLKVLKAVLDEQDEA